MKMKRLVALALVGGLLAGGVGVAEGAKKKKKKKAKKKVVITATPVNYYVALPNADAGCDEMYLTITAPAENFSGCGAGFDGGLIAEALITAGQEEGAQGYNAIPNEYAAVDGIPFVLDATKDITGQFVFSSWAELEGMGNGVGNAKIELSVLGDSGGETKTIGSTVIDKSVTPGPGSAAEAVEFTVPTEDSLNKAQFTSLKISVRTRGQSVMYGWLNDGPDSFMTMPTLVKKTVKAKK